VLRVHEFKRHLHQRDCQHEIHDHETHALLLQAQSVVHAQQDNHLRREVTERRASCHWRQ
jgi:hypothetical protein